MECFAKTRGMDDFENQSAGYLVNHVARLFAAGLQARIKPLGLSTGVFPVMVQLWRQDGQSQRDLVARVGIEQATMANTLARMRRDKLITTRPDDHDARMKRVWLTESGRDLRDPALAAARAENKSALAGLSEDERTMFLTLMRKVIARIPAGAERLSA